jgi:4,4'-diaponeurosporenoate glycosyltransferase
MALTLALLGLLSGALLLCRLPAPGRSRSATRPSVVIPARDEETRLPHLLASLAKSDLQPLEVLVVDDGSRDNTAAVARAGGARVIAAPPLPEGWTGKCWACSLGAQQARGEVIVFLDADVTLATDALARVVAEVEARGGLVSVQPYHRVPRAYEKLSAFFNLVALMGVDAFGVRRGRVKPAGAFGAVLAATRAEYAARGGHTAVRAEVLEDVALAGRFDTVTLFAGRDTAAFRMYPGGPAELIEGWSKNIASGATATRPSTAVMIFLWITGAFTALAHPASWAAYAAQLVWMLRRVGSFGAATGILYPLPLAAFVLLFARSAFLAFARGEVRWKGRTIAVGR